MLIGEYEHSLDVKGRLIMPAKIREDIGEKFIITKGLDGCLFGFSQNEWTNFEEKLKTLPLLYWNPFFLVQINNSFLSFLLFFFFEGQEKHTFKQYPQISSFCPKFCRKNCTFYRICFSCAHMGKTI